jgi:hypothetical protein
VRWYAPMLRAIETHLRSSHVARVTYGAILGMALVVVLEHHPPAPGVVVGSLLATAVAVALAELYSEIVGIHARTQRMVDRPHLRAIGAEAAAVAFGVAFPAVFFILAALNVLEEDSAFTIAKWSGLGLIAFYGLGAARLSGAGWLSSTLQALAVAAIGAALIAFKAIIH